MAKLKANQYPTNGGPVEYLYLPHPRLTKDVQVTADFLPGEVKFTGFGKYVRRSKGSSFEYVWKGEQ